LRRATLFGARRDRPFTGQVIEKRIEPVNE